MAFGSMLDKAKDTAKSAADSVGDVTKIIAGMIDDINAAMPILAEYGYKMNELEIGLGLVPKVIPHFSISGELTEEQEKELLSKLEGKKIASLVVNALIQASKLQSSIKVNGLKFTEVEIEASVPPNVTLKFS
jgi:hypothetical protein